MKQQKSRDLGSRSLFLSVGLCISLSLTLMAFEFRSSTPPPEPLTGSGPEWEPVPIIPPTEFPEPKPPVIQQPKVIEVPEDEILDEPIEDWSFDPADFEQEVVPIIEMEEEEVEPGFVMLPEEPASFKGGMDKWTAYLKKNLKYPRQAQRMGIEGKVFLRFYVDAQGQISNLEVIRGIGGGCDEEALRVLKASPQWNPGLQRGRPVKSPMTLYILFKLR